MPHSELMRKGSCPIEKQFKSTEPAEKREWPVCLHKRNLTIRERRMREKESPEN